MPNVTELTLHIVIISLLCISFILASISYFTIARQLSDIPFTEDTRQKYNTACSISFWAMVLLLLTIISYVYLLWIRAPPDESSNNNTSQFFGVKSEGMCVAPSCSDSSKIGIGV